MSANKPSSTISTCLEEFEKFVNNHGQVFKTKEDKEFIRNVFNFASEAHKNMKRFSGAPYISHPLEVAKIVVRNIGLGKTSAAAALLHDVPNKTEYTTDDIERYFGTKISTLVAALNKIKNTEYFVNNQEASVFREIMLSMSTNIRVIFIKIADKLHSVRTLEYLSFRKQKRIVNEVLNIYAPLAHRLGLFEIKSEMEDLCLKHTNPNIYRDIQQRIKSSEREKLQNINRFLLPIKEDLDKTDIEYRITSRAKSIYSIWKKIKQKRVPFKEIYDIYAVRIIYKPKNKTEENILAYNIAEIIKNKYEYRKERIRDWIEIPKETGYRAYHLTVKSQDDIWVEVQIRSEEMHRSAEHGLAAHWRYKGIKEHKLKLDEKIAEIVENLKKQETSAEKFMDDLKLNFFTTEIYVFTPKGQLINLPKYATVLDFAFKIHSSIGAGALSAKINGKTVPLNTELHGGDKVEIIYSEKPNPRKEWLNYVTTHKALADLKILFRQDRKAHQEKGREIIENIYDKEYIYDINNATNILMQEFGYKSIADFYIAISENKIPKKDLLKKMHYHCTNVRSRFWTVKLPNREFKDKFQGTLKKIKIADCCNPVPEYDITGIYDKSTVLIHKTSCAEITNTPKEKHIEAVWASYSSVALHRELTLISENTKTVILKIAKVLSKALEINVRSIKGVVEKKQLRTHINLFVKNEKAMQDLVENLSQMPETKQINVGADDIYF